MFTCLFLENNCTVVPLHRSWGSNSTDVMLHRSKRGWGSIIGELHFFYLVAPDNTGHHAVLVFFLQALLLKNTRGTPTNCHYSHCRTEMFIFPKTLMNGDHFHSMCMSEISVYL